MRWQCLATIPNQPRISGHTLHPDRHLVLHGGKKLVFIFSLLGFVELSTTLDSKKCLYISKRINEAKFFKGFCPLTTNTCVSHAEHQGHVAQIPHYFPSVVTTQF